MKNIKTILVALILAISFSFASCEKKPVTPVTTPPVTEVTKCYTCTETTEHHSWSDIPSQHGYENSYFDVELGYMRTGPYITYRELQYCGTREGMRAFEDSHDNNFTPTYEGNENEVYCDCVEN